MLDPVPNSFPVTAADTKMPFSQGINHERATRPPLPGLIPFTIG